MTIPSLRCGASFSLALLALACGHGGSPSSSSTPAPAPAPTAAGPVAVSCPFGKGSLQTTCSRGVGTVLLPQVEAAIEQVAQQTTGILDVKDQDPPGSGQYRIVAPKPFIDAVVGNLQAAGLCAQADYDYPFDRVNVKNSGCRAVTCGAAAPRSARAAARRPFRSTPTPAGRLPAAAAASPTRRRSTTSTRRSGNPGVSS